MFKLFDVITIDLKHIILPIIYIVIGIIVYEVIRKMTNRIFKITKLKGKTIEEQRVKTIRILILNFVKYIIGILVVLAILSVFNVNVKSIVAGLGITTAILGLAFQDMAKDLIAGISIITENQYKVGDTIEIDGFMGEVIFLGLKTTRIRNYKGAIKIIANHHMDKIINYSLHDSLAIIDVSAGREQAPAEIEKVLNNVVKKLDGKIPNATGKLEIWGMDDMDDSSVVYRLVVEVKPMEQYSCQRFLRKEIKEAFDEANIKIPYQQIEVHNGK